MPIFRLNFVTKLIFIHLTIKTYDIPGKTHNPTNHLMDNNVCIFLHMALVTSLSTADLTPNFSESDYIYHYYLWYVLCSDSTNSNYADFRENFMLPHCPTLGKVKLPRNCHNDVLEKCCYKIIQV